MLFIFQLINFFTDIFTTFTKLVNQSYKAISDVYLGLDSIWYFISGHTLPLPAKYVTDSTFATWKYNSSTNAATYLKTSDTLSHYKLSWLSANISINDTTHDMDDFISSFTITTNYSPDIRTIINLWCIYSNVWYAISDNVKINIIDANGEDIVLGLNIDNTREFSIDRDCVQSSKSSSESEDKSN